MVAGVSATAGGGRELGIPTPQQNLEALPLWGGRKVRVLVVSNPRKRKTGKTRDQRPIAGRGRRLPARGGGCRQDRQPPAPSLPPHSRAQDDSIFQTLLEVRPDRQACEPLDPAAELCLLLGVIFGQQLEEQRAQGGG